MTKNKYGARKVKTEDGTFDSEAEYRRWCQLKLLAAAGEIRCLRRQTKHRLEVAGVYLGFYKDDFSYLRDHGGGCSLITEDVKGVKTPIYNLKKKLMWALHGIEIQEVHA